MSLCVGDCPLTNFNVHHYIDSKEFDRLVSVREHIHRVFVFGDVIVRGACYKFFHNIVDTLNFVKREPLYLKKRVYCGYGPCNYFGPSPLLPNDFDSLPQYLRTLDVHTYTCFNCFVRFVCDALYTFGTRSSLYGALWLVERFVRDWVYDTVNSQELEYLHSEFNQDPFCEDEDFGFTMSAVYHDYVVTHNEIFHPGPYTAGEYDDSGIENEGCWDEIAGWEIPLHHEDSYSPLHDVVFPQSGLDVRFLRESLSHISRDFKSKDSRNFMKVVLNAPKSKLNSISEQVRETVYKKIRKENQTTVMTEFHKSLKYFSSINEANARRLESLVFVVKPQLWKIPSDFTLNFGNPHITHNVDIPVLSNIVSKITELCSSLGLDKDLFSVVVNLFWFLYDLIRGERLSIAALRLVSVGLSSSLISAVLNKSAGLFAILKAHVDRFTRRDEPENSDEVYPQVGPITMTSQLVESFTTMLFAFLCKGGDDVQSRVVNAEFHESAKVLRSSKTIAEFIINLFRGAMEAIKWLFTSEQDKLNAVEVNAPQIAKWLKEVEKLDMESGGKISEKARVDPAFAHRIFSLKNQADKWIDTLGKFHANAPFWTMFMEKYRRFMRMHDHVRDAYSNYNSRAAPFVGILIGKAGVGKSFIINRLLKAMYKLRNQEFNSGRDMYMRAQESEYWDGYSGQKVLYYNDIFQTQDEDVNRRHAMEVISAAQTVPMPLNCARLEKKDNIFFNSEFIIADCNNFPGDTMVSRLISESDALYRRFQFRIKVELKKEFSLNGRFYSGSSTKSFVHEAYNFEVWNTATNEKKKNFDWISLVKYLSEMWLKHRVVQKRNVCEEEFGLTAEEMEMLRTDVLPDEEVQPQMGIPSEQGQDAEMTRLDPANIGTPEDTTIPKDPKDEVKFDGTALYVPGDSDDLDDFDMIQFPKNKSVPREMAYQRFYHRFLERFWLAFCLQMSIVKDRAENYGMKSVASEFLVKARESSNGIRSFLNRNRKIFLFTANATVIVALGLVIRKILKGRKTEDIDPEYERQRTMNVRRRPRHTASLESTIANKYRFLDHYHEGLPDNVRTPHSHACDKCGAEFSHTHVKRTYEQSIKYPHLCRKCVRTKPELSRFGESETAFKKLYKNQYNVINKQTRVKLNGFFLKDHIFVIPNHFFDEQTTDDDDLVFTGVSRQFSVKVGDLRQMRKDLAKDLRLFVVPNRVVAHADVSKFLMSSDATIPCDATLMCPNLLTGEGLDMIRHCIVDLEQSRNIKWGDGVSSELVDNVRDALSYSADTGPGDCGGLLVTLDDTNVPRIVGMHMAGSVGRGFSGHLTRERIDKLLNTLKPEISRLPYDRMTMLDEEPETTGLSVPLCSKDNIEILGVLPPTLMIRPAVKTRIFPSVLSDTFEPKTAPAMLKVTDGIDPMRNGVKKMARRNVDLETRTLETAKKLVQRKLFALKSEYIQKPRNLTDDEALNGVHYDHFIQPVNIHTSPGWPYRLDTLEKGKTGYIEGEVPDLTFKNGFDRTVHEYEQTLIDGRPRDIYFFDCLKDERRPIEKAESGNTRVFSVGPLDFTLMMRKYTAFFQAHCMANCTECGSAVGINPHSREWTFLLKRLEKAGDNFIAGDYGKWDKWVPYQLMMAVLDIVNSFYGDDPVGNVAREALFAQAFGAKRIAGRVVYQTTGGMPSGTPGTAVFNSIANEILFCYVFEVLRQKNQPELLPQHYNQLVEFTAYGDDHVVAVSDVLPWFNMITVSEVFSSLGIEYTSADKSTTVFEEEYVELKKLTYLKRGFVYEDDYFALAPLSWSVITECILWSRKGENPRKSIISTMNSALIEAVHHGYKTFQGFEKILETECRRVGLVMPTVDFFEMRRKFRGEGLAILDRVSLCDPAQVLE